MYARFIGLLVALALLPAVGYAQSPSLISDAETEQFILDLSQDVIDASRLDPKQTNLLVVHDSVVNAYALESGGIVLTTGLIQSADSPLVLTGVVAHELGHFLARHHAHRRKANSAFELTQLLSTVLGLAAIASGEGETGAGLLLLPSSAATHLLFRFTRRQENEADQNAIRLLNKAMLSPIGLVSFFDKLAVDERYLFTDEPINPYLLSHPLSQERLETLKSARKKSPWTNVPPDRELTQRLRRVQAKLRAFLSKSPARVRFKGNDSNSLYGKAIVAHRTARTKEALKLTDTLLTREPNNPYFHEFKGQILLESSRPQESIPSYRAALENTPKSSLSSTLLTLELTRALVAVPTKENLNETLTLLTPLTQASQHVRVQTQAWERIASTHGALDNEAMATFAAAKQYAVLGDPASAHLHAQRALRMLPKNSPSWLQVLEIVNWARDVANQSRLVVQPHDPASEN